MGFIASKILWMFLAPGNFLILLMLIGGFLLLSSRTRLHDIGQRLCFDVAFLLFFIAIFPVGEWMLLPLEDRFPPARLGHVDGIIVLGGDEDPHIPEARHQPAFALSASRYLIFAALAREYPKAKLVYAGGSSNLTPVAETSNASNADVVRHALANIGVPVERIVFEDKSRTTHENAVDAAALVHPKPDQDWLLVTNAFHMPRAIASFRAAGWNVHAAPAGYITSGEMSSALHFDLSGHLTDMTLAAHEYYGLVAYRLMGYTNSLWPR